MRKDIGMRKFKFLPKICSFQLIIFFPVFKKIYTEIIVLSELPEIAILKKMPSEIDNELSHEAGKMDNTIYIYILGF